jgi:DNA-binding MarR family transcriptional regulator/GNAT superfamily N-acetyltransferase
MQHERIQDVRRFNRLVTQRVGALSDHFLARDRPLGEARVLWEIGPDGCAVRALRGRLGLDSGYLSRLLRALETDGLLRVEAGAEDRRVRVARLTRKGLAERRLLDRRSDQFAASLLESLDEARRSELVEAMRTVERLLTLGSIEIRDADPAGPDARRCLDAYAAELNARSDSRVFDPRVGSTAEPHEVSPPAGRFVIAYLNGEPVGCGAVKHNPGEPSDIKRMWLSPDVRGLGLGRRLLAELEARVLENGVTVARLETNGVLTEAVALYRAAGYREVEPFNDEPFADHWFEKELSARPPVEEEGAPPSGGPPPRAPA